MVVVDYIGIFFYIYQYFCPMTVYCIGLFHLQGLLIQFHLGENICFSLGWIFNPLFRWKLEIIRIPFILLTSTQEHKYNYSLQN